mgnify:CR=1 FL=1
MTMTQFSVNVGLGTSIGIALGLLCVLMVFQLVLGFFGVGTVWSFTYTIVKPFLCGFCNTLCVRWFLKENIAKNVFKVS